MEISAYKYIFICNAYLKLNIKLYLNHLNNIEMSPVM